MRRAEPAGAGVQSDCTFETRPFVYCWRAFATRHAIGRWNSEVRLCDLCTWVEVLSDARRSQARRPR